MFLFAEKDVMTGGSPSSTAAGWAGWAVTGVSSLTSKIYSKATKAKTPQGMSSLIKDTECFKQHTFNLPP